MTTARALVEGKAETVNMVKPDPGDPVRSIQLYGVEPATTAAAVDMLVREGLADHVDLNFGCPAPKVTRRGGGSALPWKLDLFAEIVAAAVTAARRASASRDFEIPVTAKIRIGIDEEHPTFMDAARIAGEEGIAGLTLHARTTAQHYAGRARWEAIGELVQATSLPVFGNGDVFEAEDARRMMSATGCAGVAIGRGCQGRPWLFRDLAAAMHGSPVRARPGLAEVAAAILRHAELSVEHFNGDERRALREMRKHTAWYLRGFSVGGRARAELSLVSTLEELRSRLDALDLAQPHPDAATGPRGRAGRPKRPRLPEGWLDSRSLTPAQRERVAQAEIAVEMADAVLLVVDAQVGITETDARVVRMLRRSGKPVVLAANKVDSPAQEGDAATLWNLGLGEPFPVSALHGRGSGEVLDAVMEVLPEVSAVATAAPEGDLHRIALVGRPNVGKSSLLNSIAGQERVVVNETAGTTRDPVDEIIELDGRQWVFVDTAGIRRRVKQSRGADYYAVLRTQGAIDKAEVAVVLLDASEPISEQDVRVVQQAVDAGRALVLVNNKWDLVDEERQKMLLWEVEHDLAHVSWAPHINLAARTGWHTNRLVRALDAALEGWTTRVPTGRLNGFLGQLQSATPHPVRGGKQPRILFATQVQVAPPRIVIFTTGFLDAGYRRFIERRLREEFGFTGTPIQIGVRVREKRQRR